MAHENTVEEIMMKLQKATARQIGEVLHAKGLVSSVASGDATCRRVLEDLITRGKIKKDGSCFMLPNLSGFADHDKKLTGGLIEFLKRWNCDVYREHSIQEVGLRPDALILVKNGERGACIILEVTATEKKEYLQQKLTTWKGWKSSLSYLSDLFGTKIPCFNFTSYGRNFEGVLELTEVLKKMEEA